MVWPAFSPDLNPIEEAWNWMKTWLKRRWGTGIGVPILYQLPTIPGWRRLLCFFDLLPTLCLRRPGHLFILISIADYLRLWAAMVTAHRTQMVWYRWGWVFFWRYMFLNELEEVDIVRAACDYERLKQAEKWS